MDLGLNNFASTKQAAAQAGTAGADSRQRTVLVLDDDLISQKLISSVLQAEFGCKVLNAKSVSEAQLLVAENRVDLFILDVNLPDGNGLDFLCDVLTTDPGACAVVITGVTLPGSRKHAESLGALAFVEKPISRAQLTDIVRKKFEPHSGDTAHLHHDAFAGSLSGLSVLDIVQLKCLSGSCRTLEFNSAGRIGKIYFEGGKIVHAETEGLSGMPALSKILLWANGKVSEKTEPPPARTLSADWQVLLLEAIHNGETTAAA